MLRSDVETVFRRIAADVGPALPYGSQLRSRSGVDPELNTIIHEDRRTSFNYIEVSSLRTGGKRVVGKPISIYVAIVVSVAIFAYKLV